LKLNTNHNIRRHSQVCFSGNSQYFQVKNKIAGFHSALAKREDSTANPPSWISRRAAREVVNPYPTKKIPNGSTAHPCAKRALTIIPDGYTVF
jgi:hypothetical protein